MRSNRRRSAAVPSRSTSALRSVPLGRNPARSATCSEAVLASATRITNRRSPSPPAPAGRNAYRVARCTARLVSPLPRMSGWAQ